MASIKFFKSAAGTIVAAKTAREISQNDINALQWLLGNAQAVEADTLEGWFVGPRREMITPWSTTAVEITQNMNIEGLERMEEYFPVKDGDDKTRQRRYNGLDQEIFTVKHQPEPVRHITDFEAYDKEEGLALSAEEIRYLKDLSDKLGRPLTDSEVFGFSQVNSEHCRHKIFNGTFIIDGVEQESSLFKMIKKTTAEHRNSVLSA